MCTEGDRLEESSFGGLNHTHMFLDTHASIGRLHVTAKSLTGEHLSRAVSTFIFALFYIYNNVLYSYML